VADHLGLDLDLVELLARVDANDAANHLGDDDHVTEVRLDEVGLLVGLGLLLGLAQLLDQAHGLALEAAVETSTGTRVDEVTELLRAEVEEPGWRVSVGAFFDHVSRAVVCCWIRETYWSRSTPR